MTARSCDAVLAFPSAEAGIDVPLFPRTARRAVTAISRAMMTIAAHSGNRSTITSEITVAETRSLSESGSSQTPVRVVIPWKYGFKSAKSIVRIRLTDTEPNTAWNKAAPQEYGFYSNVNPAVDHPRWSQATERRIGEFRRRATLPFNGYADQVASLYSGMDLKKNY